MYKTLLARRQELEDRADNEGGFTLIELLVVVVIIGILVAIAIPLYLHFENGAKTNSTQSDAHNLVAVVQQCAADNNGVIPLTAALNLPTLTFTCGTTTEVGTLSPNNTLAYTSDGSTYTIAVTNSQSNKTTTYSSSTGQTVTA